jgi:DNA-binding CsgD family transcriptional regulator
MSPRAEGADTAPVRTADDPDATSAETHERSPLAQLSPREHEILALLSEGLTGRAIAGRLFLSPETVRTHVRNATTKLGAKTRVQAVAMLVREPGFPVAA